MHPVKLEEGEVVLLKRALKEGDWKILPTFKLKYIYQRFTKNSQDIQDIAREARSGVEELTGDEISDIFR